MDACWQLDGTQQQRRRLVREAAAKLHARTGQEQVRERGQGLPLVCPITLMPRVAGRLGFFRVQVKWLFRCTLGMIVTVQHQTRRRPCCRAPCRGGSVLQFCARRGGGVPACVALEVARFDVLTLLRR